MNFKPLAFSLSLGAAITSAFAGSPRLAHVYPAGGQRGAEAAFACSGTNLGDARELLFDAPGFKVVELKAPDEKEKRLRVKVAIAPEVSLGEHSFRVVTNSGVSDVRLFYVSPFPMAEEQPEVKETPDKPQPIALGTTVFGRTQGEDMDRFEVEAKKGQRISAEVIAARLHGGQVFDTLLTVTKADGTLLMQADDVAFSRQDPVTSVVAPEDGKYLIAIKEATNTGAGECHYILNVGTFPRPLAVHPSGGKAGEEVKFTLLGDAAGPILRTVKLPEQTDEEFKLYPEDGQPAPQPNLVRVSALPNILEVEPNNDITKATPAPAPLPVAFNGVLQEKGDIDCFKFTAKKDASYDISVHARRLRSPVDSTIDIYDAKGARVGNNDDAGSPDSYLRWKAPADGDYFLQVNDQLKRGGPTYAYRVEITAITPRITAALPEMVQNSNQERRAFAVPKGNRYASLVRVKRQDVGGDMTLVPEGLPPGVTVSAAVMDKSVDTIPMVFEAAADAAPVAKAFTVKPTLTEPPKDTVVKTAIENEVAIADNGNQAPFYTLKESSFAIAVTEEAPVKLQLIQPKVPILQSGTMNLKVVAERKADFKAAINLALLYTPPGFGTAGTVTIKEGENEGVMTISAQGNAPLQKWKVCVVGSYESGKGAVWVSTGLVEVEVAPPLVAGQIVRTFVDQGDAGSMTLKLDQKLPFDGKAKVELVSLPTGVTAEPREITKDDKEVKFVIKAAADAQSGQHKQVIAQFTVEKNGEKMVNTIASGGILRVDKATVAKK